MSHLNKARNAGRGATPAKTTRRKATTEVVHKARPGEAQRSRAYREAREKADQLGRVIQAAESSGTYRYGDPRLTQLKRDHLAALKALNDI